MPREQLPASGHIPESGAHAPPLLHGASRLSSVDLLRGVVIILMALDHARDYFAFTTFDPADLTETTPGLFLTRWITHFCAPVFVFLAGLGAALSATKGKPRHLLARSLFLRGCWLIFLEFTVVRAAWFLGFVADATFRFAFVQVIWTLGWSMIFLALLLSLSLPRWAMFAISAAIALGHNALDHVTPESLGSLSALWKLLHVAEPIHWWGGPKATSSS